MKPQRPEVCTRLDQLLAEHGQYRPLDLLLLEGWILYQDYEAWRSGQCEYLEERLHIDADELSDWLTAMAREAARRKLMEVTLEYQPWGGGPGRRFSSDPELERLCMTAFERDRSHPQLDLFYDNQGIRLLNEALAAFGERNLTKAREATQRLMATDPLHPQLDGLLLLGQLDPQRPQLLSAEELSLLEERLAPEARTLLGSGARDYLHPLWVLAARSVTADPALSRVHPASFWHRAEDWPQVLESIEAGPEWQRQLELLELHCLANMQLQRSTAVYSDLCLIAWQHEARAEAIFKGLRGQWRRHWLDFLDLEPELPTSQFPAWLLLRIPSLVQIPALGALPMQNPAPGWTALFDLMEAETKALAPEARTRLKAVAPELLSFYLRGRR